MLKSEFNRNLRLNFEIFQTIEEGKTVDFISTLKITDKTVIITWYKQNTVIRESSDTTITFDGTTARLTITKCKISHSAVYKIVAKNEFGEDESSATLTVTEKKKKEEEEEEEEVVEKIEEKKEEKKVKKIDFLIYISKNPHY